MTELLVEKPARLEFEILRPGDNLTITTGQDTEAWRYNFKVNDVSAWPNGPLQAVNPTGEISDQIDFELHGCGRWTSRRQNPVQTQEKAFTPYYEGLIVGSFLWGRLSGQMDRVIFDKHGQEISEIAHTPYRENAVLQALGDHVGTMSVREMVELTADSSPQLQERDIRKTLAGLVKSGHVSQLRKKVIRYKLTETI